jgi:AbrB family looped-hinge helix DNA binding protein
MRTTIDRSGRLVVPKAIRDRLQIVDGADVDVDEHDGVIEVRVAPVAVVVTATPEGPTAVAVDDVPPLTDEVVRETLDRVRR